MEILQTLWEMVRANYQEYLIVGAIMVTNIFGLIGLLKVVFFNRIKNEEIRHFLLSLSDIVASFTTMAIYFAWNGIAWRNYVFASIALSFACIIVYWVYETIPYLRTFIDKLVKIVFGKLFNIGLLVARGGTAQQIEKEFQTIASEVVSATKKELKSASKSLKKDKELENL